MRSELKDQLREVEPYFNVALIEALVVLLETRKPESVTFESLVVGGGWMATRLRKGPQFALADGEEPMGLPWLEQVMGEAAPYREQLRQEWFDDPRIAEAREGLLVYVALLVSKANEGVEESWDRVQDLVGETGRQIFLSVKAHEPDLSDDWRAALKIAENRRAAAKGADGPREVQP